MTLKLHLRHLLCLGSNQEQEQKGGCRQDYAKHAGSLGAPGFIISATPLSGPQRAHCPVHGVAVRSWRVAGVFVFPPRQQKGLKLRTAYRLLVLLPTSHGSATFLSGRAWKRRGRASPHRAPRKHAATTTGPLYCVVAETMALEHFSGSQDLKIPEPTKTASAPSCITKVASAGAAMPPPAKLGTGSLPCLDTHFTSSNGAPSSPWP